MRWFKQRAEKPWAPGEIIAALNVSFRDESVVLRAYLFGSAARVTDTNHCSESIHDVDVMLYLGHVEGFPNSGLVEPSITMARVQDIIKGLLSEVHGKPIQYHVPGNLACWYSGQTDHIAYGYDGSYHVTDFYPIKGTFEPSEKAASLGVEIPV